MIDSDRERCAVPNKAKIEITAGGKDASYVVSLVNSMNLPLNQFPAPVYWIGCTNRSHTSPLSGLTSPSLQDFYVRMSSMATSFGLTTRGQTGRQYKLIITVHRRRRTFHHRIYSCAAAHCKDSTDNPACHLPNLLIISSMAGKRTIVPTEMGKSTTMMSEESTVTKALVTSKWYKH